MVDRKRFLINESLLNALSPDATAVSYTHLDVYKRQAKETEQNNTAKRQGEMCIRDRAYTNTFDYRVYNKEYWIFITDTNILVLSYKIKINTLKTTRCVRRYIIN